MTRRGGWSSHFNALARKRRKQRVCQHCNGTGRVHMVVGRGEVQQDECPECGGLGELRDPVPEERISVSGSYPTQPLAPLEDWRGPQPRRLSRDEACKAVMSDGLRDLLQQSTPMEFSPELRGRFDELKRKAGMPAATER